MQNPPELNTSTVPSSSRSIWKTVLLVIGVAMATSILTVWLTTRYLFPREFAPVTLDASEKSVLDTKIAQFNSSRSSGPSATGPAASGSKPADALDPEPYSETDISREVTFSERELNALLANNSDLARRFAIDLSENLASAKLLIPLDPDIPLFGGKTLKVAAGLNLSFANGRPVVALQGISLWGVPIPNAWLGGIKNLDLVKEFGSKEGFWQAFADGVEDIRVEQERLTIRLRE